MLQLISRMVLIAVVFLVPLDAQQPTFRQGVQLVVLNVTVQQPNGAWVEHLQQDDFRVFDEGAPQQIVLFSAETIPIDLLLLIDTSNSMSSRLDAAKSAADHVIDALGPRDRAGVMTFADRSDIVQPFTSDHEQLRAGVERLRAGGRTALFDSIDVALRELRPDPTELRRRALIVLSDGEDTESLMSFDRVLDDVRAHDIAVYTVSLAALNDMAGNARFSESQYAMRRLAHDSGGRFYSLSRLVDLSGAYTEIARELSHQYSLAFVPKTNAANQSQYRRLSVVVNAPSSTTRTRSGYVTTE